MTFFARPDLSDVQFKQLSGSTLTLTGTTQIVSVSGLSLSNGSGGFIPVAADSDTPITNGMSLAYDSVAGRIRLMNISGGTGISQYLGASPTTCTVGGLTSNTDIYGTGFTCILEMMLVPTVDPTLISPSQSFSISPPTSIYEVGTGVTINSTTTFNRGTISPNYDNTGTCLGSSKPRAGLPYEYVYSGTLEGTPFCVSNTSLSNSRPVTAIINAGNNSWSSCVRYSSGETAYDSTGGVFVSGLSSGFTLTNRNFAGIFPYFWGRWATTTSTPSGADRPSKGDIENCIIALNATSGTSYNGDTFKVVAGSSSTITIPYNSNPEDYLWFAIPNASTSKTCWYVTALNNGAIGGAVSPGGNLFPNEDLIEPSSPVWDNWSPGLQTYKLYLSNYQSKFESPVEIRN